MTDKSTLPPSGPASGFPPAVAALLADPAAIAADAGDKAAAARAGRQLADWLSQQPGATAKMLETVDGPLPVLRVDPARRDAARSELGAASDGELRRMHFGTKAALDAAAGTNDPRVALDRVQLRTGLDLVAGAMRTRNMMVPQAEAAPRHPGRNRGGTER